MNFAGAAGESDQRQIGKVSDLAHAIDDCKNGHKAAFIKVPLGGLGGPRQVPGGRRRPGRMTKSDVPDLVILNEVNEIFICRRALSFRTTKRPQPGAGATAWAAGQTLFAGVLEAG